MAHLYAVMHAYAGCLSENAFTRLSCLCCPQLHFKHACALRGSTSSLGLPDIFHFSVLHIFSMCC